MTTDRDRFFYGQLQFDYHCIKQMRRVTSFGKFLPFRDLKVNQRVASLCSVAITLGLCQGTSDYAIRRPRGHRTE